MDDIQFWLYILFAVIYFITRGLKKKKPEKQPRRQPSGSPDSEQQQRKPVSFEDLLKEFTEEQSSREEPEEEAQEYEEELQVEPEIKQPSFEEGVTRRFSDEESKKIYEESIEKAEGASLDFERNDHFKSSIKSARDEEAENTVAKEIRDMLSDPEDVKKAIVLSEILNRKY